MQQQTPQIFFTDYFQVSHKILNEYGAFNISLVTDLPLFIDPFLLFNSRKIEYQRLHSEIIKYLRFLKDKSVSQKIDKGLLNRWYKFKEIKQNWFGFSKESNEGRGLGSGFAVALNENLHKLFKDFGNEKITRGSHLERLCLIKDKVGRDNISDFTTNLIKEYLLNYTQNFAKNHLDDTFCQNFPIDKVRFNYQTESWERESFYLPTYKNDYIILTPKNILTKDETWINKTDLIDDFNKIADAIPNDSLRSEINNYLIRVLPKKPKEKEKKEARLHTIQKYPILIDYFIRYKEDNGSQAQNISAQKIRYSEDLYIKQFKRLVDLLASESDFYTLKGDTYFEARQRIEYLKNIIENKDGYKIFYVDGEPIKTEDDLHILFKFVWCGSPSDVSSEVNDGRGPADFKVSRGAKDKTIVEFKLARNTQLKRNLQKQLGIYKNASNAGKGIHVIVYFNEEELKKVYRIMKELKLETSADIILIDARQDNKVSASKA